KAMTILKQVRGGGLSILRLKSDTKLLKTALETHRMRHLARLKSVGLAVAGLAAAIFCGVATAQTPGTGAISGVVSDPSSRVVVNAGVLVVSDATQVSRAVTTTADGTLHIPLLRPGAYTVKVEAAGFAVSTTKNIQVTVGETSTFDVTLALAGAVTSVQV